MCGCKYYFEFDIGNSNCVWIKDVERCILELIYIMINGSRDCDLENVIVGQLWLKLYNCIIRHCYNYSGDIVKI